MAGSNFFSIIFQARTVWRSIQREIVYIAVTRHNAVWRVPLMRDGTVAKVGIFIQMSGGTGRDGLAVDEEGNLAVAHVGLGASGSSVGAVSHSIA